MLEVYKPSEVKCFWWGEAICEVLNGCFCLRYLCVIGWYRGEWWCRWRSGNKHLVHRSVAAVRGHDPLEFNQLSSYRPHTSSDSSPELLCFIPARTLKLSLLTAAIPPHKLCCCFIALRYLTRTDPFWPGSDPLTQTSSCSFSLLWFPACSRCFLLHWKIPIFSLIASGCALSPSHPHLLLLAEHSPTTDASTDRPNPANDPWR